MNPREMLVEQIADDIIADDPIEEVALRLEKYAIGRWVSVEERLPDKSGCYLFVWGDDEPQWIDYTHGLTDGETPTHWLELDLPSGKEEA